MMLRLNRSKLLAYNASCSLLLQALMIISGFVLPHLYIQEYGADIYGLVVSVTQYLQIISLCELGFGAVVQSALYKPIATDDIRLISKIYVASKRFFRLVATILIAYVILLVVFFPVISNGQVNWALSTPIILAIAFKLLLQYYFGITYRIILNASQLIYIQAIIGCIVLIISLIISIIIIELGFSIIIVLTISSLIFILQPAIMAFVVNRIYKIDSTVEYETGCIPQKWNGMAQHFATVALENVPVILLTAMTSMGTIAIYSLYHMVTNGLKLGFQSLLTSINPLFGNIIAKEEHELLKTTFNLIVWFVSTIAFLIFTVAGIVIIPFLNVYVRGFQDAQMYIIPLFGYLLCCAMLVYVLRLPFNYLIQAAGHFKQTQYSAIVEVIINLFISIIGIRLWGLFGVGVGLFIALAYRLLYFIVYVRCLVVFSIIQFLKIIILNALFTSAVYFSSRYFSFSDISYWGWLLYSLKVGAVGAGIFFIGNFTFFRHNTLVLFNRLKARREAK